MNLHGVIVEITPIKGGGGFIVDRSHLTGAGSFHVTRHDTLRGARCAATRYMRAWPGRVGLTFTYPDGEQRTYGDLPCA